MGSECSPNPFVTKSRFFLVSFSKFLLSLTRYSSGVMGYGRVASAKPESVQFISSLEEHFDYTEDLKEMKTMVGPGVWLLRFAEPRSVVSAIEFVDAQLKAVSVCLGRFYRTLNVVPWAYVVPLTAKQYASDDLPDPSGSRGMSTWVSTHYLLSADYKANRTSAPRGSSEQNKK